MRVDRQQASVTLMAAQGRREHRVCSGCSSQADSGATGRFATEICNTRQIPHNDSGVRHIILAFVVSCCYFLLLLLGLFSLIRAVCSSLSVCFLLF